MGVGWGEEEDGKEYVYKMVLTVKKTVMKTRGTRKKKVKSRNSGKLCW